MQNWNGGKILDFENFRSEHFKKFQFFLKMSKVISLVISQKLKLPTLNLKYIETR